MVDSAVVVVVVGQVVCCRDRYLTPPLILPVKYPTPVTFDATTWRLPVTCIVVAALDLYHPMLGERPTTEWYYHWSDSHTNIARSVHRMMMMRRRIRRMVTGVGRTKCVYS